jgi:iron complex outermembrane receptor protein
LRFRIAGAYNARDGFTKDTLLDEGANDQSAITGRANLLWTPTKEWSISFNATGSANQDGDNTFVPINQRDRFKVDRNIPGNTDLSVNTQALRIKYEGTAFNFTAITARNSTNLSYQSDGDYTSEDFLRLNVEQDSQIWSQEIRLQSPANADRFRWIIGGYFQSRDFDLDPQSTEYTAAGATAFNLPASGTEGTIARYDQTTLAGFGQIDFKPIKPLTLTAGLRYENSREELDRVFFISSDGREVPTGEALNDSTTEDDILLPKFAVEYRFTPNLSAYGSVTRGYKPPTQNYQTRDLALLEVKPEKSWNYEIGLKSSWLDNRLSANLAFFWNDISDYQVALAGDAGFFEDITNAEVGINGVELELKATPIDGLDVIAGFGYADAKFTQYTNPFTGQNFKDNRLLYAPEFTYNLALQYRSRGGILGRVELQGLGSYFFDDANALKQDSFALVNTRLGYEQKSYSIYFYVNNLFDERYFTSAFVSPAVADPLVSYGDRRTFGVQFKTNF